jgi:nucleotide-binding universal stress UspA family protein
MTERVTMSVINKILFPTDGSETSKKALTYVKNLALRFNSEVVVLYVYEFNLLIGGFEVNPTYIVELEQNLQKYGDEILEEVKKELDDMGVACNTVMLQGEPGTAIVEHVNADNFDLLVIGSHGNSGVKSFLIGSTSNYVIHHTNCPTLIIQKD